MLKQILILAVLNSFCLCYYEFTLNRSLADYKINTKDIQNEENWDKCKKKLSNLSDYSQKFTPQLCIDKDLVFTASVMIGNLDYNYKLLNLAIDITLPWTWIISKQCSSCEYQEKNFPKNQNEISNLKCNIDCLNQGKSQAYLLDQKQSKITKQKGLILSDDSFLQGKFIEDRLTFLVYNPDKKQNILQIIEDEIDPEKNLENREEVVSIKNLNILAAEKMMGYERFLADGAIGLGFIQNLEKKQEKNTNFLQSIFLRSSEEQMPTNLIGFFINEKGENIKENVLTLGKINQAYAFQGNLLNLKWIPVQKDQVYYWSLEIAQIELDIQRLNEGDQKNISKQIDFKETGQHGIVTTVNSFIGLPQKILSDFLKILNEKYKANCKVVDSTYFAVFCKKFSLIHVMDLKLSIKFSNGVQIELNENDLVRECQEGKNLKSEKDTFSCLLNIQLSLDDKIILGEPFLKQQYTIFDQENNQIGLVKAADDQNWGIIKNDLILGPFLRVVTYFFITLIIFGIIVIIFFKVLVRFSLKLRQWSYSLRGGKGTKFSEIQGLNQQNGDSEDNPYAEVEIAMKEQARIELQQLRDEQQKEDEQKITLNAVKFQNQNQNSSHQLIDLNETQNTSNSNKYDEIEDLK